MQKSDANNQFFKFIERNYLGWLSGKIPILHHEPYACKEQIFAGIRKWSRTGIFILIDNLRFDQWKIIQPLIQEYYKVDKEESYYSIYQQQRNTHAMPFSADSCQVNWKTFSHQWLNDEEEGGKIYTRAFMQAQMNAWQGYKNEL